MELCAKTWGSVKPLFHYSESLSVMIIPRSHADMPTDFPANDQYDWDIELKYKDAAIRACAALVGVWQMKNKEDMLEEKTLKLILIQGLCEKHIVRCPASAAQASMKSLAMKVLDIIDGK